MNSDTGPAGRGRPPILKALVSYAHYIVSHPYPCLPPLKPRPKREFPTSCEGEARHLPFGFKTHNPPYHVRHYHSLDHLARSSAQLDLKVIDEVIIGGHQWQFYYPIK